MNCKQNNNKNEPITSQNAKIAFSVSDILKAHFPCANNNKKFSKIFLSASSKERTTKHF